MKVQKLPADVRTKLQSGLIVTDAVKCVMELVHNSLDADATGIAVRVDVKAYRIRVIDNGKGIKKDDLEFVGERFMTSKYHSFVGLETSLSTYGFRGQALSGLLDVSKTLTIETKSEDNGPTLVKVFKNNQALPIIETESRRSGSGTTITIEDFMYTMPVRRKRISEIFDLEEIKNQLQYLAIIHYNVCFTLRNENKGLILLQTSQASNILESLTNIFGKTLVKSFKPLNYSEKKYEITGFISLKPQPQNNVQLLYLNKKIVTKGVIHKFINNMIKEYRGKKTSLSNPSTHKILKTLKNSYNAYIIQIKCPQSYYELFTNLRKTTVEFTNWKDVLKCVHKAVKRTFKNDLNLDSSSNSQQNDDKNVAKDDNECKRAFGTSFLVNAVKGAPAKRGLNPKKDVRKGTKLKTSGTEQNTHVLFSKNDENQNLQFNRSSNYQDLKYLIDRNKGSRVQPLYDSLNSVKIQKDCTNDSLESPIPKKKLKHKVSSDVKLKSPTFNKSFLEFYEWLKKEFETDPNAFSLYHNFLHGKNNANHTNKVSDFKSPVLGGKLKKKNVQRGKNQTPEISQRKISNNVSGLNKKISVMTQNHLKILPSGHLRMKKAVQFSSEMNGELANTFNLNCIFGKNLSFEKPGVVAVFKKPEDTKNQIPVLRRNERQIGYNQTLLSLPSSEAQFTNIIKFRNLSESFFYQSSFIQKEVSKENAIAPDDLNTWSSHYQTFSSNNKDFYKRNRSQRNYASWMESKEEGKYDGGKNLKNISFYGLSDSSFYFTKYSNNKNEGNALRDVEIQVDILGTVVPVQKVNAIIQTVDTVPASSSFENSYAFNESNFITAGNIQANDQDQLLENNFSQEVPNPDFWNTSVHMQLEGELITKNEINAKNPSIHLTNKNHSISSEFFCGHKSHSSSNLQNEKSSSKETQTLAAIWTDSLTKLGSPTNLHTEVIQNSQSKNMQLAKTTPLEEIKNDIFRPVGSEFYLTERHEFVPKGLSPSFLKVEKTNISILSPREKSRLKLAIDNTQNDLLANIKWQDESTGNCIKPTIPDGIIFEMRQRAGENAMNFENPVLSATLSYCAIKIQNLLHSFAFTKELLSNLEILGQLDKKFIVTLMKISAPKKMELLSLFDQHAVDERIKLEEIINENISSDGKFISSCLDTPVECVLADFDVQIVSDLKEKMHDFGLGFELVNKNTLSVTMIPTFLLKKYERDLKNKKEINLSYLLKSLIANIIDEVTETRGAVSKIPKIIHNAFCLEACHKAIKFNKALTSENMIEMINKLQNCKLPFQCAHGRPSVIPIIDLQDFKSATEVNDSIDLQNLKRFYNQRKENGIS